MEGWFVVKQGVIPAEVIVIGSVLDVSMADVVEAIVAFTLGANYVDHSINVEAFVVFKESNATFFIVLC